MHTRVLSVGTTDIGTDLPSLVLLKFVENPDL